MLSSRKQRAFAGLLWMFRERVSRESPPFIRQAKVNSEHVSGGWHSEIWSLYQIRCWVDKRHCINRAIGVTKLNTNVQIKSSVSDNELLNQLSLSGPINRERTCKVLEQFGLDAVVLGDPLNVFHVLGYWPQISSTKVGQPPTTFVILPKNPTQPPAIISSHFIYYYTFTDGGPRSHIPAYLYETAGDNGEASAAVSAMTMFADLKKVEITSVEARRRSETDSALNQKRYFADAGGALVNAIKDTRLNNARLGYDHQIVKDVCERHEVGRSLVFADNIMRWIRVVKSPLEIELMKRGARANVEAVNAVVSSVRKGANYRDLRRIFAVEAAKRGNQSVFMTIDRVSSSIPTSDTIIDGQSLFIDGVSHFQNYHGDYARTVFVGEPNRDGAKVAKAAKEGWEAIRAELKPGLRYSDIVATGLETIKKVGAENYIGFGPHSVGLMHTDEPGVSTGGFYGKENLVLEENMILSVDCPSLVTGVGGSVHLEDLVRITADGAETIHPVHDHVITI